MRFHALLSLSLSLSLSLLAVPSLLQAQRGTFTKPVLMPVAATVTIPALSFRGNLGGVYLNVAYSRVNTGGDYLDLNGPTSSSPGSAVSVFANTALPAGSYSITFDFVNVAVATQFRLSSSNGTTLGTCSLASGPGYLNVQSCTLSLALSGATYVAGIEPTSGNQMTLKQVTVTRYQ